MRVLRYIMALVALACAIGAWQWQSSRSSDRLARTEEVITALETIREATTIEAAMERTPTNARRWPNTIDPEWFDGKPPMNTLLPREHPWLEVATPEQYRLEHPPERAALTPDAAGFWYNPWRGIIRARVPLGVSDQSAIDLYNTLNGSSITTLFDGKLAQTVTR